MKPNFTQLLECNPDLKILPKEELIKYWAMCEAMNLGWFPKNKPLLRLDEIVDCGIEVEPNGILTFTMPYKNGKSK